MQKVVVAFLALALLAGAARAAQVSTYLAKEIRPKNLEPTPAGNPKTKGIAEMTLRPDGGNITVEFKDIKDMFQVHIHTPPLDQPRRAGQVKIWVLPRDPGEGLLRSPITVIGGKMRFTASFGPTDLFPPFTWGQFLNYADDGRLSIVVHTSANPAGEAMGYLKPAKMNVRWPAAPPSTPAATTPIPSPSSVSYDPVPPGAAPNVAALLSTIEDFAVGLATFQAGNLLPMLSDPEAELTYFLPTNRVLEGLAAQFGLNLKDTLAQNAVAGVVAPILLAHVVVGRYMAADLKDGQVLTTRSPTGATLRVSLAPGRVTLIAPASSGNVTKPFDLVAGKSVVHAMDAVLLYYPVNTGRK